MIAAVSLQSINMELEKLEKMTHYCVLMVETKFQPNTWSSYFYYKTIEGNRTPALDLMLSHNDTYQGVEKTLNEQGFKRTFIGATVIELSTLKIEKVSFLYFDVSEHYQRKELYERNL